MTIGTASPAGRPPPDRLGARVRRGSFDSMDSASATFDPAVIAAAQTEREVSLTTQGRKTGAPHQVTTWIATDGQRVYIRSGPGLGRDWPQNLLASGRA